MNRVLIPPESSSFCRSCSSKNLEKYEGALEFSVQIRPGVYTAVAAILTIRHNRCARQFKQLRPNLYGESFLGR